MGWCGVSRLECYKLKWDKIKTVLREAPSFCKMKGYIDKIGLLLDDFDLMYRGYEGSKDYEEISITRKRTVL